GLSVHEFTQRFTVAVAIDWQMKQISSYVAQTLKKMAPIFLKEAERDYGLKISFINGGGGGAMGAGGGPPGGGIMGAGGGPPGGGIMGAGGGPPGGGVMGAGGGPPGGGIMGAGGGPPGGGIMGGGPPGAGGGQQADAKGSKLEIKQRDKIVIADL